MTDRRYSDEEISAIFARAAEEPQRLPAQPERSRGFTLTELQEIGREAGISPDAVEAAARSLAVQPQTAPQKFFGLPIAVERSVELGRTLSDDEWGQLVVHLRGIFHARGRVASYGDFREWSNGNLQVLLEPTTEGHRLTLRTMKGSARSGILSGVAVFGVGIAVSLATGAAGHLSQAMPGILMMTSVGAALSVSNALGLPTWARRREQQMDSIIRMLTSGDATRKLAP